MNEQESSAEDARGMVRRGDRRGSNYVQKAREKLKGVPHALPFPSALDAAKVIVGSSGTYILT